MSVRVAVLGLNRTGASTALALAAKEGIEVATWDKRFDLVERAQRTGIPGAKKHLKDALKSAHVVLFALPAHQLRDVLAEVKQYVQPGALLVNMSGFQLQPAAWVKEQLPEGVPFVSIYAALNPKYLGEHDEGPESARADLFQNGTIYISEATKNSAALLNVAVDLAVILGGKPAFADMHEADGLRAWVEVLPAFTSIAAAKAAFSQPGWREARKLAGDELASVTNFFEDSFRVEAFCEDVWLDRENAARVLDALLLSAARLKDAINQPDEHAFFSELERLQEDRQDWLARRAKNDWGDYSLVSSAPSPDQALKQFLTLGG